MAPALSDPSVTRALHRAMDEDMGADSLAKDQEMEQILVDLGGGEADLLQAIKNMEGGSDADAIFPLAGFERELLADTVDSESDAAEEKIRTVQARLEKRCSFLLRRLRILQARAIGKRVSEEVAQSFDKCARAVRHDPGPSRTSGLKGFLKRAETTAVLQASGRQAGRPHATPRYFRAIPSTSSEASTSRASLGIAGSSLAGLSDTAAALRSGLNLVSSQLDSDATASSSGAESNDEAVVYNNPHQKPLPIEKRALWSWQRSRSSIAARWCWLQAQVQELEYKIRQHSDLHRQVRVAKGPVQFEGSPTAYEGQLPGEADEEEPSTEAETCARVRPLRRDTFKKRKLLQMHNLHTAAPKAAKPADIRCGCQWPVWGCGVCTGRAVATVPLPPLCEQPPRQRLALIDPGYHPVLSDIHDVSGSVHVAAPPPASTVSSAPAASHHHHPPPHRRKYSRSKRGRPPLSRKQRERDLDDISHERGRVRGGGGTGGGEARPPRLLSSSYDIDNIVIPHSVAASTRPEILHYKEIITPKWRVLEVAQAPLNNGIVKARHSLDHDTDEEDISEARVLARHQRMELNERCKYARKKRTRRSTNQQNSVDGSHSLDGSGWIQAVGDGLEPAPPPPAPPQRYNSRDTPPETVSVRPYSPRVFPLPDTTYRSMVSGMPPLSPRCFSTPAASEDSATLSPLSAQLDDEDPNDPEWDLNKEHRSERVNR